MKRPDQRAVEALRRAGGRCDSCDSDRLPLHYWRNGIVACGPCLDRLRAKYDRVEV